MAPDPNLASLQKQWAADDAERFLMRCTELAHELAEIQAAYINGGQSLEAAAAIRGELAREHDRQAQAAEAALERLKETGPVIGAGLAGQSLETAAGVVRGARHALDQEWQHHTQQVEATP